MAAKYGPESLQARVISRHFQKKTDNPEDFYYKCLIDECSRSLNGKNKFNLVAHAKTHRLFFGENYGPDTAELINLPVKRLEFIQHCTELVTVNSEPFALLSKSGFLKLNRKKLQQLKDAKLNSGLTVPKYTAVKDHISYLSTEIVNEIKMEVDGKFVSLMVDGATKNRRSILGIYVQFMVDSAIVIRSIGMVHLTARHTGEYLASVILDRLKLFGIRTSQLIAITTDNGSNMKTMVEHLNEAFGLDDDLTGNFTCGGTVNDCDSAKESTPEERRLETDSPKFTFKPEKDYDTIFKEVLLQIEMDEICDADVFQVLEEQANMDSVLQDIQAIIDSQSLNLQNIRCAAHTLQLAVMNALDIEEFKIIIKLCRGVCKELRKNSNQIELEENCIHCKVPRIDVKTRWNSIYSMVSALACPELQ